MRTASLQAAVAGVNSPLETIVPAAHPALSGFVGEQMSSSYLTDLTAARVIVSGGRALASKAMIMRLFAGAPRDEVLAIAHRLLGDGRLIEEDGADSQARTHVIGCLSGCDDYGAAEGALRLSFAGARAAARPSRT